MKHKDFCIGLSFWMYNGMRPLEIMCTDIGMRTVIGIRMEPIQVTRTDGEKVTHVTLSKEEAIQEGWFKPDMGSVEHVYTRDDWPACYPTLQDCLDAH